MRQRWVCVHWSKHTFQCGTHAHTQHTVDAVEQSPMAAGGALHVDCFQSGEQVARFWIRGIHHFCFGRSLSEPSARQPGLALQVTWPLSWPRWLGALAGQRGDTNHGMHKHLLQLWCLISSLQSFLLIVIFYIVRYINCFWIIFGSQQCPQSQLCSLLSPALTCILPSGCQNW